MDKAEIRAIAEKALQGVDNVLHRPHGMSRVNSIEAALTAAYDQGKKDGALEAVRRFGDSGMEATMRFFEEGKGE